MKLVVVPSFVPAPPEWDDRLRDELPGWQIVRLGEDDDPAAILADADVTYGDLTPSLLAHAPGLRLHQSPMANPPAGLVFDELRDHPAVVANARGIYYDNIGTHVMAFVLAFARRLDVFAALQREHRWDRRGRGVSDLHLPQARIVVVGVGGIGAWVAARCADFGATVLGVDPRVRGPVPGVSELVDTGQLDEVLGQADVVVNTVPQHPSTDGMFGAEQFAAMKPGALYVNVGRGSTTDLDALVAALRSGHLGGAGLDVTGLEPLPEDHPLWDLDRVMITPHIAEDVTYTMDRRYRLLVDNARAIEHGTEPRNAVDKLIGF